MTSPTASNAREIEKAVIWELLDWAERLRHFAIAHQAVADEGDEEGPEKHYGMSRAYRNASEFISRRAAEISREGWSAS